jgi:hypothetical protein
MAGLGFGTRIYQTVQVPVIDRLRFLPWAGRSGFWSSLHGVYANSALDPVTSSVGMLLDLSRGVRASPRLGDQLIDAPWGTPAGFSGGLTYDGTGAKYSKAYITVSGLVPGQWYELTARLSGLSSGSVNFGWGNGVTRSLELPQKTFYADGVMRRVQRATSETMSLVVQNNKADQTFAVSGALVRALNQNLTGLGPELISDFTGAVGVIANTGLLGSELSIQHSSSHNAGRAVWVTEKVLEPNSHYLVKVGVDRLLGDATGVRVGVGDENGNNNGAITVADSRDYVATGTGEHIFLVSTNSNPENGYFCAFIHGGTQAGGGAVVLRSVSVQKVPSGIGPLAQDSESLRPYLESDVLGFDGIQHSMGAPLPDGGPNRGSFLIGLKTTDPSALMFRSHTNSFWVGVWHPTETNNATPVYVDGTLFNGSRAGLSALVADGKPHVLEFQPAAMSSWDELHISAYTSRRFEGQVGGICLWDETASGPLTDHHRSILRPLLLGGLA